MGSARVWLLPGLWQEFQSSASPWGGTSPWGIAFFHSCGHRGAPLILPLITGSKTVYCEVSETHKPDDLQTCLPLFYGTLEGLPTTPKGYDMVSSRLICPLKTNLLAWYPPPFGFHCIHCIIKTLLDCLQPYRHFCLFNNINKYIFRKLV